MALSEGSARAADRNLSSVAGKPQSSTSLSLSSSSASTTLTGGGGAVYRVISNVDAHINVGATAVADGTCCFVPAYTECFFVFGAGATSPVVHGILASGTGTLYLTKMQEVSTGSGSNTGLVFATDGTFTSPAGTAINLVSSVTPTAGTDTAVTLDTSSALDSTDKLLSVKTGGTEKLNVAGDGSINRPGDTLTLNGFTPNSGSNVGVIIDNGVTLSGSTKLLSVKNNGSEKLSVDNAGGLNSSGSIATSGSFQSKGTGSNTLYSDTTDSSSNIAFTIRSTNPLTSGRSLLAVNNEANEKFKLDYNGNMTAYGSVYFQTTSGTTLQTVCRPTGTAVGLVLNNQSSTTALGSGDKILSVQSQGVEKLYVDHGGDLFTSNVKASTALWGTKFYPSAGTSDSVQITGFQADSGSAVGVKIGNYNSFSTTGAKIAAFYSDNLSTEKLSINKDGKLTFESTDNSGTPDDCTINKPSGKAAVAIGDSACVVTNSCVTTSSIIIITPLDIDATLVNWKAVPASGSFTVTGNTTATAAWKFQFLVLN